MKELLTLIKNVGSNSKIYLYGGLIAAGLWIGYQFFYNAKTQRDSLYEIRESERDCLEQLSRERIEKTELLGVINYNRSLRHAIDSINNLRGKLDE